MASSNKKVPKQENKNMDSQSDNSTAPKTTRKRKEKRSNSDSPKRKIRKKLAKEWPGVSSTTDPARSGKAESTADKYPSKTQSIQ